MTSVPPADLNFVSDALYASERDLLDAFDDNPSDIYPVPPAALMESLQRLLTRLADPPTDVLDADDDIIIREYQHINDFADYGLKLFVDLAAWAKALGASHVYEELRKTCFAFGLWLAEQGAEITLLEPLVDYLAILANELSRPLELEQAYIAASKIMDAANPLLVQEDSNCHQSPWHNLLLVRAIIAIRSNHPLLVKQSFQCLAEFASEDVPSFLREIINETDNLQLSEANKLVIEKYLHQWPISPKLH